MLHLLFRGVAVSEAQLLHRLHVVPDLQVGYSVEWKSVVELVQIGIYSILGIARVDADSLIQEQKDEVELPCKRKSTVIK